MEEENIALVRGFIDAFTARDDDGALALADPRVEFRSDLVEQKTYRGHAGVLEYRRDLDDAWSEWRFEDSRFLDADETRVLQLYRLALRGRESGAVVHLEGGILWNLRAGRIVTARGFLDQAKALEAAGVRE